MAGTLKVLSVVRPVIQGDGISGGQGTLEQADYLLVSVDRFSNGAVVQPIFLLFSEYAGLEAEWGAGSATTVLDAAIETEIGVRDVDYGSLTEAQRAYLGTQIAIAD